MAACPPPTIFHNPAPTAANGAPNQDARDTLALGSYPILPAFPASPALPAPKAFPAFAAGFCSTFATTRGCWMALAFLLTGIAHVWKRVPSSHKSHHILSVATATAHKLWTKHQQTHNFASGGTLPPEKPAWGLRLLCEPLLDGCSFSFNGSARLDHD